MTWRATALALATASVVFAGEQKWTFVRLVDAPLAPVERPAPVKILKVTADPGPAADGDATYVLTSIPTEDGTGGVIVKSPQDKTVRITPDISVDPLSKAPMHTWRVFVGGEVVRPGAFNAQRPFTALQAVIAAGGLKDDRAAAEIVVLRYREKDAPPTKKSVNLSATLAGKGVNDLWLETHDVVIVPKPGTSSSTEEIMKGLPIPIAKAAKSQLEEVHRVKLDASEAGKLNPLVLPAR